MFIDVQELRLHPVDFHRNLAAAPAAAEDSEIERVGPIDFSGQARLAGDGMRLSGHLRGEIVPRCARCLAPAAVEVDRDVDLLYQPESLIAEDADEEIHGADTEVAFFEGEGVEVDDVAREQLLLALPMQPLCRPDCRGLCPHCGVNLNETTCDCPAEAPAPQLKLE